MTRPLEFNREVGADLNAIRTWYGHISPTLVEGFNQAFETTISHILAFPFSNMVIDLDARRTLIRRFPYSVAYRVDAGVIVFFAVYHLSRDSSVWLNRLG